MGAVNTGLLAGLCREKVEQAFGNGKYSHGCELHRSFVTWAYSPAEVAIPARNRSQAA